MNESCYLWKDFDAWKQHDSFEDLNTLFQRVNFRKVIHMRWYIYLVQFFYYASGLMNLSKVLKMEALPIIKSRYIKLAILWWIKYMQVLCTDVYTTKRKAEINFNMRKYSKHFLLHYCIISENEIGNIEANLVWENKLSK